MTAVISVVGVRKTYQGAHALRGVDVTIPRGKLTVITGPSGSGKTTLLNLLASLDRVDDGTVTVDGVDITRIRGKARDAYRASNGHVFQRSGLLAGLSVRENITAPHLIAGKKLEEPWLAALIERLDLSSLMERPASSLSGGQAQRVALARALVHRPRIVFADEPTASLDTEAKQSVLRKIRSAVDDLHTTVLMVSHDQVALDYADTSLTLVDGLVAPPAPATPVSRAGTTRWRRRR
jgi:putative ABC transport system ATP-binding protein